MDVINEMNNLVQNLKVFKNEEFGQVRATSINKEPWFVGKDIASILGYANTSDALKKHVDKEDKGVAKCDTLGGKQTLTVINESGLYSLILSSKLPNAKKFKRWVTSEVLPSIRKTGGYIPHDENMSDDEIMARALLVAQKTIEEKSKLLQQAKETIEDMKPKALVGECLEVSKDSILVRELAKILKQNGIDIGQNRLFEWLRENGYLIKTGSDKNMPTQRAMNLKLFEVKHTNMICNGETKIRKTTMVTGKGINYFLNKFISLEVI